MTPHELYLEAARRGLRLEPRGDRLAVIPKGKCPPDFRDVLLAHKAALLEWLAAPKETWAVGKYPPGEFDDVVAATFPKAERRPLHQVHPDPEPRKTAEEAAWLHVARQILAGEFENCDRSTSESLAIGLRSISHPICQQALARLKALGA